MKAIICSIMLVLIPGWAMAGEGKKLLKQHKYAASLLAYLEAIEAKPSKKGLQKDLGKVLPEIMAGIDTMESGLLRRTLDFRGDVSVSSMNILIGKYETLQKAFALHGKLGITQLKVSKKQIVALELSDYSEKLIAAQTRIASYKEQAAEMHYAQALVHQATHDRPHQKAAAREFKRAIAFVPGYKDAQTQYDQSRQEAMTRIIILPYINRTNNTSLGALGHQVSSQLAAKLTQDQAVMEFLDVVVESELRAALTEQGHTYGTEISAATAADLRLALKADAVYMGSLNQILTPGPEKTLSAVQTHTAKIKVGEKTVWNDKKNKEEVVDVREDRTANYRIHSSTYTTSLTGSRQKLREEGPHIDPFTLSRQDSQSWTSKAGGNAEVYAKVERNAGGIPSLGTRVGALIGQIVQGLYGSIRGEILQVEIPLITEVASSR